MLGWHSTEGSHSIHYFTQQSLLLSFYSVTPAALHVPTRSVTAFLSLFPALWQAEESDLGSSTQQTTSEASLAGSASFPHYPCPMSPQQPHHPAAPTLAPQSPAERAQSPPHLLVVLHEPADPLTLDLPFRLLKLLPPLLLLVLPVAVFFLPAIETPHRVGSGSLTQRTNRFAHGGGC